MPRSLRFQTVGALLAPVMLFMGTLSGVAAILGGVGLLAPWALTSQPVSATLLWGRLPLQLVFIGVAWWLYRAEALARRTEVAA
jgi:hypothetical protein